MDLPTPTSRSHPARRRYLLAAAALLSAPAWALTRGSGRRATENRDVSGFEAVAVAGDIELVLRQGEKEAVAISADDNVLPLIETVVEPGRHGRTLYIRLRRGESVFMSGPIKAAVDVLQLKGLALAGSGSATVGALQTPRLELSVAGSGDVRLAELRTESLQLRVSGSSDVTAAGSAREFSLRIAGSGDVDAAALVSEEVTVSIAGSGDAKVTANKALKVSIAGSGDVSYGGSVTEVRRSIAGSGSLKRRS